MGQRISKPPPSNTSSSSQVAFKRRRPKIYGDEVAVKNVYFIDDTPKPPIRKSLSESNAHPTQKPSYYDEVDISGSSLKI